jgi:immune inhibitor A
MKNKGWIIAIISIALLICCCLVIIVMSSVGLIYYQLGPGSKLNNDLRNFPSTYHPAGPEAYDTLNDLKNTIVPNSDLGDLANRLKGIYDIPDIVIDENAPYEVGDQKNFWIGNTDNDKNFQIGAKLQYITPHVYFWIENGVKFNQNDMQNLVETFENNIYPIDREFFGSEWTPGIDNDPHLFIVYAKGIGSSVAGYFSSIDSVNPLAHQYSNAHEIFIMSADNVGLDEEYAYSVLAHEFQHMIHWYRDRNEDTWLNEGFAELAVFINGYNLGGFDTLYLLKPDLQLTDWSDNNAKAPFHYGASFLFVNYFLDRFGEKATQALVAESMNGLNSIEKVLVDIGAVDPQSGKQIVADEVFRDWSITNLLNDNALSDGRYGYRRYQGLNKVKITETQQKCPLDWQQRTVFQYGVDYVKVKCKGNYFLDFEGVTEVGVLPDSPHSGVYTAWSNKGDESDMVMTRSFDFTGVSDSIVINYWAWYDLEKGYDYAYLLASEDGQKWEIINMPSCTKEDPSGNSYGCGYTGKNGGWKNEIVDLSQYIGKKILLRFEYITDAAINGEGLMVDDIAIPVINYQTDFEQDNGGWEMSGFIRLQNRLPQTYLVSIVKKGTETTIENIVLDNIETAHVPIIIGDDVQEMIIIISGTSRFTRQQATYRYRISP